MNANFSTRAHTSIFSHTAIRPFLSFALVRLEAQKVQTSDDDDDERLQRLKRWIWTAKYLLPTSDND